MLGLCSASKVLKVIQGDCRLFMWTSVAGVSKRALVASDYVYLPKSAGGLNMTCVQLWNKPAIFMLLWYVAQKKDKVWVKWIHGYYVKARDLNTMVIPSQA